MTRDRAPRWRIDLRVGAHAWPLLSDEIQERKSLLVSRAVPSKFSPHDPPPPEVVAQRVSDRSFGLLLSGAILVATFFPAVIGHDVRWWLLPAAAIACGLALVAPAALRVPHKVWLRVARLLSSVVSPLIVGLLFFGTIAPIAIVTRLFGRDVLQRRFDPAATSYWVDRQPRGPAHLRTQY